MSAWLPETPEQTRLRQAADREFVLVGVGTFVVTFIGLVLIFGWLILRFVAPDARWWDVLFTALNAAAISFVGAMGLTAGALHLLNHIHYLRGVYRCPYCDRRQKGFAITCDCPGAKEYRDGNGISDAYDNNLMQERRRRADRLLRLKRIAISIGLIALFLWAASMLL